MPPLPTSSPLFHPVIRRWFTETLGKGSAPQLPGWPAIAAGDDTLILAPTGTGKTLADFLWELNALVADGLETPLANAVHLLYVSPFKALNTDVERNLNTPLELRRGEWRERAEDSCRDRRPLEKASDCGNAGPSLSPTHGTPSTVNCTVSTSPCFPSGKSLGVRYTAVTVESGRVTA